MVKRIDRLTPTQAARMPEWRDKWIASGLSTAPMTDDDKAAVAFSLRAMYRAAKLPEPKRIIFVPSPVVLRVAGGIAAGAIYARTHGWPSGDAVNAAVDAAVGDAVGAAVNAAVRRAVGDAVRAAVGGAVRAAVDGAVDGEVRAAVDAAAGDAVDAAVKFLRQCAIRTYWQERGGNFWAAFPAWCSFFRDVCGLELAQWGLFSHLETTQTRCGTYSLHADFAMVSDRPSVILRDAGGRLHAETGPAIQWRDGSGFYFWHGLRVPARLIEGRNQITPDSIEAEDNAELRRVALEIYGFDRYLSAREARVIAADELHGQPRRLMVATVRGEPIRIVEVVNGSLEPDGTRRKFHLGAMRGETPAEVIAASYGIKPEDYREAVRT